MTQEKFATPGTLEILSDCRASQEIRLLAQAPDSTELHLLRHVVRLRLRRAGKRQSAPGPVSSERSGATWHALCALALGVNPRRCHDE